LDLPWLCLSDNASTAISTVHHLSRCPGRCAPHGVYIPVKNFFPKPKARQRRLPRPPRPAAPNQPLPDLFDALEQLRAWAMAFSDAETAAAWCQAGFGGRKRKRLHIDSPSKWGSTWRLVVRGLEIADDMARFKNRRADLPELPLPEGWLWLEAVKPVLHTMVLAMSVLQETTARAAQVVPTIRTLEKDLQDLERKADEEEDHRLGQIAQFVRQEVQRVIVEHFQKPWPTPAGPAQPWQAVLREAGVENHWQLCEIAALLACGTMQDTHQHYGLHKRERSSSPS